MPVNPVVIRHSHFALQVVPHLRPAVERPEHQTGGGHGARRQMRIAARDGAVTDPLGVPQGVGGLAGIIEKPRVAGAVVIDVLD